MQNYLDTQAVRLNALGGIAGVTAEEVLDVHFTVQSVRARHVRAVADAAGATAIGIPVV